MNLYHFRSVTIRGDALSLNYPYPLRTLRTPTLTFPSLLLSLSLYVESQKVKGWFPFQSAIG